MEDRRPMTMTLFTFFLAVALIWYGDQGTKAIAEMILLNRLEGVHPDRIEAILAVAHTQSILYGLAALIAWCGVFLTLSRAGLL